MTDPLTAIWVQMVRGTPHETRSDFRFDSAFYSTMRTDTGAAGSHEDEAAARAHHTAHGRTEGVPAMLYEYIREEVDDLDAELSRLAREPRLREAIAAGEPDALALLFELIALGEPIDKTVSDFSAAHYTRLYTDIARSGMEPFLHYLRHGRQEGRQTLQRVRQNCRRGARTFDPHKPTCLIAIHEFSATGAPMVALQMAERAARDHNVVVAGLRDGRLGPRFDNHAVLVLWTALPLDEFDDFAPEITETIEFAILNSVECFPFLGLLCERGLPFASYVHEFTDYTLPAYKTLMTARLADIIAFSSETVRASWQAVFHDAGFDSAADSLIVPQAPFEPAGVPEEDYKAARETLSALIGEDVGTRRIIYGAGEAQWRKGTDIFVMTAVAARQDDPGTLYVWIGDGRNHQDFAFGVWLETQLRASGANRPGGNLFFLPAGPYYHDICRASDVLYLSSRLDPLPNVVFDAVRLGAGVVMFEGASGFDDPRYRRQSLLERVPYADVGAAVRALAAFPRKARHGAEVMCPLAVRGPDGERAADAFETIAQALGHSLARARPAAPGGPHDVSVGYPLRQIRKARRNGRLFVWRDRQEAEAALAASQSVLHARQRITSYADTLPQTTPAFSIHVHAHYTERIEAEFDAFCAYRHAQRVLVTTDTEEKAEAIRRAALRTGLLVTVRLTPNKGRDVLPFLALFDEDAEPLPHAAGHQDNDIWCHVHLKKSLALGTTQGLASPGEIWRAFLMRIVLGTGARLSNAAAVMAREEVGLVAPFDPNIVGWSGSHRLLEMAERRLGEPLPAHPILFPVGNMFWTRVRVVRAMRALFPATYPFPNEPIADDGTEFHLIERLWPSVAATLGLEAVYLDKPGEPRG